MFLVINSSTENKPTFYIQHDIEAVHIRIDKLHRIPQIPQNIYSFINKAGQKKKKKKKKKSNIGCSESLLNNTSFSKIKKNILAYGSFAVSSKISARKRVWNAVLI